MAFQMTYQIEKAEVPAMEWAEYEALVRAQWQELRSEEAPEARYQEFLERHPCMLPHVYGEFGLGHHGAFPGAVVTQPTLPGLSSKRPDFLWLCADSQACYAVLIEIETPDKPWATASGQQHHQFTQALNQLDDWKAWFRDAANIEVFKRDYRFHLWPAGCRPFFQKYVLVYGRRDDPTLTEEVMSKRPGRQREDESHMTFDRLKPEHDLKWYFTARLTGQGYQAVAVPPCVRLGPMEADYWALVEGKEEAVEASRDLSEGRQEFLIRRWSYWDAWARSDGSKTIRTGDWE